MSPQSSSSTPALSRNEQQHQTFDFVGVILRKKNVNANFIKLAIQQPNHIKSTTIYIPRNESLIQYRPSDIMNKSFLYLDATIHVTGYSFIKDDMEMHHVEQCSLLKCAPNVKMIKEILSSLPPNYCNTPSSSSSTYADMFNMESQEELSTLLLSSTEKKSQKAIVTTIMERLSGKKKVVKWRPGRIKMKDLDILQQKEAEGCDTMNQLWQLCQPCQSFNNEQMLSSFDTRQMESSSNDNMMVINLPTGSDHVISANGKLTRREYLVTKKNNQTQWFVERIARLASKNNQPYWRFLDVGGGRGDLAVAIALHFNNAHITVVDCNESSIAAGKVYATKCNVDDRIDFIFQNFSDYYAEYVNDGSDDRIDVVVALHACGDLSDMALSFAQQNECAFVVCPCCYPKRYLAPFTPFWHGLCKNADEVDSLSRMVELDNESKDNESRRAMIVINSMRRQAFEEGCVRLEEFSNTISKRNIVLVKDSVS
jgi:hypothetical protein